MRRKINLLRRRKTHIGPARAWPFPVGNQSDGEPKTTKSGQKFIDYIRGVIDKQAQKNLEKAYDQAKQVVDEQR